MTNDEKAKAYEMALEAARKELGVDRKEWEVVQRVLHNIFPELRESEDEWIRRRMVEHFKSKTKETWCNIPVKDILKWLEKQKEQKPAEWSEEDEKFFALLHSSLYQIKARIGKDEYDRAVARLKSLRPQPKPEVTDEEIEEMVTKRSRSTGTTKSEMDFYRNGIKDAIKRFGLRPSWKPSEGQM